MCWSASTPSAALLAVVVGCLAWGIGGGCGDSAICEQAASRLAELDRPCAVTVFPINVIRGDRIEHDVDLARYLAEVLDEELIALPRLSPLPAALEVHRGMNRSRMYRRSASAFGDHVRGLHPATDYALLVEILADRDETRVTGVRYYLTDGQGRLADGAAWDFHHQLFRDVDPRDRTTGLQVLVGELRMRRAAMPDSTIVRWPPPRRDL
jgi:hypothetical protein